MKKNNRILVVDDNEAVHKDFMKALSPRRARVLDNHLNTLEAMIFDSSPDEEEARYVLTSAFQGEEALTLVAQACKEGRPFSTVFLDVRMPPGLDGVETAGRMLTLDPHMTIVLCSAYSDYSWQQIVRILGESDRVLYLRKPFDTAAIKQMAQALTRKWDMKRRAESAQQELRQARKDVSRKKSMFLSNMSHEITTSHNGVRGMNKFAR